MDFSDFGFTEWLVISLITLAVLLYLLYVVIRKGVKIGYLSAKNKLVEQFQLKKQMPTIPAPKWNPRQIELKKSTSEVRSL